MKYVELKIGDIAQKGDEYLDQRLEWQKINRCDWGHPYRDCDFRNNNGHYRRAIKDDKECIEREASEVKWNGEGLPPVGIECEIQYKYNKWFWCYIVGKDKDGHIVFQLDDEVDDILYDSFENYEGKFRPIKTEAELAAEKAAEELQCEIDMINAYLEQMDINLSEYDVQMLAKYIINREGK